MSPFYERAIMKDVQNRTLLFSQPAGNQDVPNPIVNDRQWIFSTESSDTVLVARMTIIQYLIIISLIYIHYDVQSV
jgi:hypothetical protein